VDNNGIKNQINSKNNNLGIDKASNRQEPYHFKVGIQGEENSKWRSG
jgi:hypothetical protein